MSTEDFIPLSLYASLIPFKYVNHLLTWGFLLVSHVLLCYGLQAGGTNQTHWHPAGNDLESGLF